MSRSRHVLVVLAVVSFTACGDQPPPAQPAPATKAEVVIRPSEPASPPTAAAPPTKVAAPDAQPVTDPAERAIAAVRTADRAVAYRISPSGIHLAPGGVFTAKAGEYLCIGDGAYPLRSQPVTLSEQQFASLRENLLALDASGPETDTLLCSFSPGVAICFEKRIRLNNSNLDPQVRWERTAVLLVCYGCQEVVLPLVTGERPWWRRYFYDEPAPQAALFAMAKKWFPDDPAIQRMAPKSHTNLREDDADDE